MAMKGLPLLGLRAIPRARARKQENKNQKTGGHAEAGA